MLKKILIIFLAMASDQASAVEKTCETINVGISYWHGITEFSSEKSKENPTGLAIDRLHEVFKDSKFSIKFVRMRNWPRLMRRLEKGDVDIIPSLFITEKRLKFTHFYGPIGRIQFSAFIRADDKKKYPTISNLKGARIAVSSKSSNGIEIDKRIKENYSVLPLTTYDFPATKMLMYGRTDFFIATYANGMSDVKNAGFEGKIVPIEEPFGYGKFHLGISKKSSCKNAILSYLTSKKFDKLSFQKTD